MNQQSELLLAAVAGLVTGIVALVGHRVTAGLHAIGGLAALTLVTLVAVRTDRRPMLFLVLAMVFANVTGAAWTVLSATDFVVATHVIVGFFFTSAGALLIRIERSGASDPPNG